MPQRAQWWSGQPFKQALQKHLAKRVNGRRRLDLIADKCIELALEGNLGAIREIADRMDGKVHQQVTVTGELSHRLVARLPEPIHDSNQWLSAHAPQAQPLLRAAAVLDATALSMPPDDDSSQNTGDSPQDMSEAIGTGTIESPMESKA